LFLLLLLLVLSIVGGIVPPSLYPEDFTGYLPRCDVKNFWHLSVSMTAVVFSLIQSILAFFIRRQHSDGLFLRRTLLGCSYYTIFICLFCTFLKFVFSEEIWIKYDLFAIAMGVSHLVSGAIYTAYPLYQSTKSEYNTPSSPVSAEKLKNFKQKVLLNQIMSPKFHLFCCEEHTQADLNFWKAVESYQRIEDRTQKVKRAKQIYKEYIPDVNFPDSVKHALTQYEGFLNKMAVEYLDVIFEIPQNRVLSKMCEQQYDRFLTKSFIMPNDTLHDGDDQNNKGNHLDESFQRPLSQVRESEVRESALANDDKGDQNEIEPSMKGDQKETEPDIKKILSASDLDDSDDEKNDSQNSKPWKFKRILGTACLVLLVLVLVCWAAFPQLFEVFEVT